MTVYFNPQVQLKLRVGFDSSGPTDTGFTWTDISGWMRDFDTDQGRSFELDDVTPGSASFTLIDTDRRFDPDSTGGTYQPNVKLRKPVSFQAIHSGTTYDLFYGYVNGWDQTFPGMVDPVVTLSAVDALSLFGPWKTSTTGPEEAAEVRIGRFLDDASWSTALRALDTGGVTVAAYTPVCADILSEINRVTKTEDGLFFTDGAGKATFHTKGHRTGSTSTVTLTDTGGLPYTNPFRKNRNMDKVYNEVTVTPIGLTEQVAASTASQDLYGKSNLKRFDTLHPNTTSAADTATGLLNRFSTEITRIPSVGLDGQSDTGLWPHILGRDISDRVTIRHATRSATTGIYAADHHIEGITHTGSVDGDWTATWLLSPAT